MVLILKSFGSFCKVLVRAVGGLLGVEPMRMAKEGQRSGRELSVRGRLTFNGELGRAVGRCALIAVPVR